MQRSKKTVVWLLLLGYLVISSMGGIDGAVLCFGADGHIALEQATSEYCQCQLGLDTERSSPASNATSGEMSGKNYGDCVDVAISEIATELDFIPSQVPSSNVLRVVLAGSSSDYTRACDKAMHDRPPEAISANHPPQVSLDSVVLLI